MKSQSWVNMFYVSISKGVLDKVMKEARGTENEIIGILVGTTQEHTIVIKDAISGDQEQEVARASLPPSTIAKVTDSILKGEVKGRIVGWYHSHPGFGLFMSSTDINTQKNLQQFSSKVTALIVDPKEDNFGFFTLLDSQGVVQLQEDQVHVYENEEEVPKRFSSPPAVPKKIQKKVQKPTSAPPPENSSGPSKVIVVGVVVAAICAAISFAIFYRDMNEQPKISTVDSIVLGGNHRVNQENISVHSDELVLNATITVAEGKINRQGVRFFLLSSQQVFYFLGNDSQAENGTYSHVFDTSSHNEGLHWIKVNFTDSLNRTWEGSSQAFMIDNVPDEPKVRIIDPREGDGINGTVILLAEIIDDENNVYSYGFYFGNSTLNYSKINASRISHGESYYKASLNTTMISNGEYRILVEAQDRNLYKGSHEITVTVTN